MNELIAIEKIAQWEKLKQLVLDSVSSPITKRFTTWLSTNLWNSFSRSRGRASQRPP